jgi:hypothetical protein
MISILHIPQLQRNINRISSIAAYSHERITPILN